MLFKQLIISFLVFLYPFFSTAQRVDLIVHNARIYTVNAQFDVVEALAVKRGKIVAVGRSTDILKRYKAPQTLDAGGKTIVPGFIDAHAHFYGYGQGLQAVNLVGTKSWDDVVARVAAFATTHPDGWLLGRGWDQNDWPVKEYPTKEALDRLFPTRPVLLTRVDGHAGIANQAALDLGGFVAGQTLVGGEIEVKNGQLTGILIDNAVDMLESRAPKNTPVQMTKALLDAQANCFAVGLTTVVDCGLNYDILEFIEGLQAQKQLKMRLYVMLSDDKKNYAYLFKRGAVKTDYLNCRSFKLYADGALGSRGACLLHPYSDRANHFGFLLKDKTYYEAVMAKIYEKGFQACTHAIGDSANREVLRIYGQILKGKNDKRWRIEHAQVVDAADFAKFGQYNVIPSVQPTHATSDMYWAGQRLGAAREKGAYAFKQLLAQNQWIPLGTDFPVEDINPILTFFAAVARRDAQFYPDNGYMMENALSREETLRGMTLWAAKASFEEKEKGSLEKGKFADFIILNQDLMAVPLTDILKTKVEATFVGGEKVFERKE